jgi:hypothetical protein
MKDEREPTTGEASDPSTKVVIPLTIHVGVLKAWDAMGQRMQRSKRIEKLLKREILLHKYGTSVPQACLQEVLALID